MATPLCRADNRTKREKRASLKRCSAWLLVGCLPIPQEKLIEAAVPKSPLNSERYSLGLREGRRQSATKFSEAKPRTKTFKGGCAVKYSIPPILGHARAVQCFH